LNIGCDIYAVVQYSLWGNRSIAVSLVCHKSVQEIFE
jgi:hypothetical protein